MVALEPAFALFQYHYVPSVVRGDDGRKKTLLGRVADSLLRTPSRAESELPPEPEEYWLEPFDPEEPPIELQIIFDPDTEITPQTTSRICQVCSLLGAPLALEVVAERGRTHIQLACQADDRDIVLDQVSAHIPSVVLEEHKLALPRAWLTGDSYEGSVVDFGLADEFMLPIETSSTFALDPMNALIAAMERVEEGDIAHYQVMFKKAKFPWAEHAERAITGADGGSFFADDAGVFHASKAKFSEPLYAVSMRIGARCGNPGDEMRLLRRMSGALAQFESAGSNRLIPLNNDDYDRQAHVIDAMYRQTRRSGMLLSLPELVSIAHLPNKTVASSALNRDRSTSHPAPVSVQGNALKLGVNLHRGAEVEVSLSKAQRSRHMYVVGGSGTGKSTLLLNMIVQSMEQGQGIGVLDPHGDLIDQILDRIPPERIDDVVLFDPGDSEYPVGFNILDARTETERTLLASDLVSVFRRLSTSWGDQMTSVLANAIVAMLAHPEGGTLINLRRFLIEKGFRTRFLKEISDPEVRFYWQKEFTLLAGKPQAPILTRLDTFLRPRVIRNVVAQKDKTLDFGDIMNSGKIFLAKLAQGQVGEENAFLLGTLLVSRLQQTALARQELDIKKRRDFHLFVDEFQHFVTPSMATILSGARKFGLSLTLAHQDLAQVSNQAQGLVSAVLANAYTRVCFRLGDGDARRLKDGFAHFESQDLQTLRTGEAIVRVGEANADFNVLTSNAPRAESGTPSLIDEILKQNREWHSTPRAEVEKQIDAQYEESSPNSTRTSVVVEKTVDSEQDRQVDLQGRAGGRHQEILSGLLLAAGRLGWSEAVEEAVPGGFVDIVFRRGDEAIACEICSTTPPAHELKNLQKCIEAGFDHILLVVDEKKKRRKLRDMLPLHDGVTVCVIAPDDVDSYLKGIVVVDSGDVVAGYTVTHENAPEDEQLAALQNAAKRILERDSGGS